METGEYSEMYRLESFYWWFVARRKLLEWLVRSVAPDVQWPVILDVGCGTGMNHEALSKFGEVFSSDLSKEAVDYSKARGITRLALSRVELLGFSSGAFDLVTALDVLEHIDDDLAAMHELCRVMKPGGVLLITVPAYGFLWSEHDEALHHKRRYAAYELRNKLARAGFDVERTTYYITTLFFPILAMRIVQNIFKKSVHPKTSHVILPKWLNGLLIWILGVEKRLLSWINFPFGVSLICVARKCGTRAS
jgi:SAM-dependent methyltransferase